MWRRESVCGGGGGGGEEAADFKWRIVKTLFRQKCSHISKISNALFIISRQDNNMQMIDGGEGGRREFKTARYYSILQLFCNKNASLVCLYSGTSEQGTLWG